MIKERIIRSSLHTEWTLYGPIDNYDTFKELIVGLEEATEGDSIQLKISCTGGRCDVGQVIIQAMQNSKAVIVCHVVYPSYSMGADIAIAGDYLIMEPHTFLMFHTYSTMDGGKSGDFLQSVGHNDLTLKRMTEDGCYPFLSKAEIKKMHAGQDIYIRAEDPTLSARLKRHYKDIKINE